MPIGIPPATLGSAQESRSAADIVNLPAAATPLDDHARRKIDGNLESDGLSDPGLQHGLYDRNVGTLWVYGMQVLMVTYMMKKLGFVDTRANLVWGAAAALIYATPAIGGWIGDRLIGTRRTMRIGALVLASGYALLWRPTNNEYFFCILRLA